MSKCIECIWFSRFQKENKNGGWSGLCKSLPPVVIRENGKNLFEYPIVGAGNSCSLFKADNNG